MAKLLLPSQFGIIKPPLGFQLETGHPLACGLVACWLMNEGTGNKVFDLSGNKNSGVFAGNTAWVAAKTGCGLSFGDTGDYIDLGATDNLEGMSALTVVALVKNNVASKTVPNYIVDKSFTFQCFAMSWSNTEQFLFHVRCGANYFSTSGAIRDGTKWHHVAGTYDGAYIRIYVNGVLDGTPTAQTGLTRSGVAQNLYISTPNPNPYGWNGIIDHVLIYNRALSDAEVAQLYREPFCKFEQRINPALFSIAEAPPPGLSIPVAMRYYRNRRVA